MLKLTPRALKPSSDDGRAPTTVHRSHNDTSSSPRSGKKRAVTAFSPRAARWSSQFLKQLPVHVLASTKLRLLHRAVSHDLTAVSKQDGEHVLCVASWIRPGVPHSLVSFEEIPLPWEALHNISPNHLFGERLGPRARMDGHHENVGDVTPFEQIAFFHFYVVHWLVRCPWKRTVLLVYPKGTHIIIMLSFLRSHCVSSVLVHPWCYVRLPPSDIIRG